MELFGDTEHACQILARKHVIGFACLAHLLDLGQVVLDLGGTSVKNLPTKSLRGSLVEYTDDFKRLANEIKAA